MLVKDPVQNDSAGAGSIAADGSCIGLEFSMPFRSLHNGMSCGTRGGQNGVCSGSVLRNMSY